MVKIPVWGGLEQMKWDVPTKQWSKKENSSFLCLAFCFMQDLSWLDGAYPHGGGRSTLLNQPVQMRISSRSTLHRHTQKQLLIWVLHTQTNWHIKVTITPIMSLFFHLIPQVWHLDINFCFKIICLFTGERERAHAGEAWREMEREKLEQAPRWAPHRGSISQLWDRGLSQNQELNTHLTVPPRCPNFDFLNKYLP